MGNCHRPGLPSLTRELKDKLVLLFVLDPAEDKIYDLLKNETIRRHQVKSQALLTSSLKDKSTALSVAGKIGLQVAAKRGLPIWEVARSHPHWAGRKVALTSMGYSRNPLGTFTLAFVGSTNSAQTAVFNFCQAGLPDREAVAGNVLEHFYKQWLLHYHKAEDCLPSCLVVYREGLSESQIRSTVSNERQVLETVVASFSGTQALGF